MRTSRIVSSALLLSATLSGCLGQEPSTPTTPDAGAYVDMQPTSTVSGFLLDPEAFFLLSYAWPVEPDDPEGPPPPFLVDGTPYLEYSSITGANVSLVSGSNQTSGSISEHKGVWQVFNVPRSTSAQYVMKAEPTAAGVELGAGISDPSPVEVPQARYVPTTTLRPIVPSVPLCQLMVATMVGEAGALSALAQARSSTVANLLDPSKTGGVVLTWVFVPSMMLDWVQFNADQVSVESSAGQVYSLDWASPGAGGPGQSPMGFMASAGGVSPIGYYAIVLPPGGSGPLSVQFVDHGSGEDMFGNPRPWFIPPLEADIQPGGVSVARVFALPGGEEPPPPEDTDDEPSPGQDFSWVCM